MVRHPADATVAMMTMAMTAASFFIPQTMGCGR
jgi:hypothetical protein